MERELVTGSFSCFFIAMGVILGGSIIGGIGAFLGGKPPLNEMVTISRTLRIWAIVAAIGGTFDAIDNFERGFMDGTMLDVIKQTVYIFAAILGTRSGESIIHWMTEDEVM